MGIKHFFYWFKSQFMQNMKKLEKNTNFENIDVSVDNLMIDMNGVFHNSAQKIYEYGNFKPKPRLLRKNVKNSSNQSQKKVFEDVCQTVENIFKIVKPKKRLILCVDGPAPLGKQAQQRQRRFRSAAESSDDSLFNSNCITPGTKFMDFLTKYIDWYIRKRINEDSEWQKIQVIFSNEKASGEGEQKLIEYIRLYGDAKDSFCINGLDADIIMLALATHMPKMYILREDLYDSNNDFFCLDIGEIRKELAKKLEWKDDKYKFDSFSAINDFVFLCFIVGNDFLPHIPSIEIIENGIELILEVYKETCSSYGHITEMLPNGLRFRPKAMKVFLGTIGQHEKTNFENKLKRKKSYFPDPLLENSAIQLSNGDWKLDIEKYKSEYFLACFPAETEEEKLCHQYFEGMQWVLSYYTKGVPNWKWQFKYHYAPPASILAKHMDSFIFPEYSPTIPSTPFQQLLCVLPPKSADLIPKPLCDLLTDENSPLKNYCPKEFEIDIGGKRKEWEGTVILPFIDFNLVRSHYLKNLSKIDKRDLKRNVKGKTFIYEYLRNNSYVFKSYYGDIEKCCVRNLLIDL